MRVRDDASKGKEKYSQGPRQPTPSEVVGWSEIAGQARYDKAEIVNEIAGQASND